MAQSPNAVTQPAARNPISSEELAAVRAAVAHVISAPEFKRSARMVRFLTYLAEQSLAGALEQLAERPVGIAVFDREAGWDPKIDPIVRIEARRLREKLAQYYSSLSAQPEVTLSIPKGSYRLEYNILPTPVVEQELAREPEVAAALPAVVAVPPARTSSRRALTGFLFACALAAALVFAGLFASHADKPVREDRPIQIARFRILGSGLNLDGSAVASMLADQIRGLQKDTRITWPAARIEDPWSTEAAAPLFTRIKNKLDAIASTDDMFRAVPASLSGFIQRKESDHIEIYLRGDCVAARTFSVSSAQLPGLLRSVADSVYAQCQPAAYSVYLVEQGRFAEAIAFSQQHYGRATHDPDRMQLLYSWASALDGMGDSSGAADKYWAAIQIMPDSWGSYSALIDSEIELGRYERALEIGELLERRSHRGSWLYAHLPRWWFRPTRPDTFMPLDQLRQDWYGLIRSIEAELAATAGAGAHLGGIDMPYAQALVLAHDRRAAQIRFQIATTTPGVSPIDALLIEGDLVHETSDTTQLRKRLAALREMWQHQVPGVNAQNSDEDFCTVAELYNENGDILMADRLLSRRRNSPGCLDSKAQIEVSRNHRAHARSLFESAIDAAPHLPEPHYRYGLFLLSNQEAASARREFELAHVYGPHWAEPLKSLGDLDLHAGEEEDAIENYNEAIRYAPKWSGLHRQLGLALSRAGRRRESEMQMQLASAL
jgi:tetratricopeptide (TPR) repeat protein